MITFIPISKNNNKSNLIFAVTIADIIRSKYSFLLLKLPCRNIFDT